MSESRSVLKKLRTIFGWVFMAIGVIQTSMHITLLFFDSNILVQIAYLFLSMGILIIGIWMARRPNRGYCFWSTSVVMIVSGIILALII